MGGHSGNPKISGRVLIIVTQNLHEIMKTQHFRYPKIRVRVIPNCSILLNWLLADPKQQDFQNKKLQTQIFNELAKALMNKHLSTDQVGSELIHGEHNRQKFLLRCSVIQLGYGQRLTGIWYGIMLFISALTQHCSHRVVTCIAHNLEWKFPIGWLDDGSWNECLLEGVEGYEAFLVKVEQSIFCQ